MGKTAELVFHTFLFKTGSKYLNSMITGPNAVHTSNDFVVFHKLAAQLVYTPFIKRVSFHGKKDLAIFRGIKGPGSLHDRTYSTNRRVGGRDESVRRGAGSQWIVAARPLCHLQCPVAYLSRLQRIQPTARWERSFEAAGHGTSAGPA